MKSEAQIRSKRNIWRSRNHERRVAKLIKGVVVGRSKAVQVDGQWIKVNTTRPPDVVTSWLSVESKCYKQLPRWLLKIMTQAIRNAPDDLLPVAWVTDREDRSHFVIMREEDFLEWHVGDK
jgi:hypothetical protein